MCLARPRERPEAQGRRAEGRPGPDPPSSSPPALSAESKAPAASGKRRLGPRPARGPAARPRAQGDPRAHGPAACRRAHGARGPGGEPETPRDGARAGRADSSKEYFSLRLWKNSLPSSRSGRESACALCEPESECACERECKLSVSAGVWGSSSSLPRRPGARRPAHLHPTLRLRPSSGLRVGSPAVRIKPRHHLGGLCGDLPGRGAGDERGCGGMRKGAEEGSRGRLPRKAGGRRDMMTNNWATSVLGSTSPSLFEVKKLFSQEHIPLQGSEKERYGSL